MNRVMLIGRLTRDPEVRYSQGQDHMAIARYTLAVNRISKDSEADFITCVAFGKRGEFAEKYLRKGMKIAASGRIQTGSYTNKEGRTIYTTDVIVDEQEFCESKNHWQASESQEPPVGNAPDDDFMSIPEGVAETLPFN